MHPDVQINCFLLCNNSVIFMFFSFYPFHSVILTAMPEANTCFCKDGKKTPTPTKGL